MGTLRLRLALWHTLALSVIRAVFAALSARLCLFMKWEAK